MDEGVLLGIGILLKIDLFRLGQEFRREGIQVGAQRG
jgi:hypothetical protein